MAAKSENVRVHFGLIARTMSISKSRNGDSSTNPMTSMNTTSDSAWTGNYLIQQGTDDRIR